MIYKSSLDNLAKGITTVATILFIVVIYSQLNEYKSTGHLLLLLIIGLLVFVYLFSFSYRPSGYELTNDNLIIHRPLRNIVISRSFIQQANLLNKGEMGAIMRTFGVGGLFGYFGKFASTKQGFMTWYATRRSGYVLIMLSNKRKIIITPDDPKRFVSEFEVAKS